MYKIITTIFLLASQTLFSQVDGIKITLDKKDNIQFNRYLTEEGSNIDTIKITATRLIPTISQDYKVYIKLEHFTTTNADIEIIDSIVFFSKESFTNDNNATHFVRIRTNNDTIPKSKAFSIEITCDSITEDHNITAALNTEKLKMSNAEAFFEKESDEVGRVLLIQNMEIPIYTRKKIGKRDSLRIQVSDFNKVNKISYRNRSFMKRYEKSDSTITAESVKVIIENGQISSLVVKVEGKYAFYKNKGPISLTNYDNKSNYVLHYAGINDSLRNTFIRTTDFIDYIPSSSRLYFPSHCEFVLDKNVNYEDLILEGSPNSFFDARAYTDTKGLSGEENGLIQTEINAQFMANSNNLGNSYMSFFKYVRMGISWSKFDSKFDTLEIKTFNNRADSDLLKILRQSNTSFEIEMDLLRGSRVADAFLTIGHRIYHTPISDLDTGRFQRVFTPVMYATLGGTIFATPRISAQFKFPVNVAYNNDQPFIDYERNWNLYLSPEVEIAIRLKKPDSKDEMKRSFVFARIKYFDMPYYRGNNYWQIQTGVEIPLSSLFEN